MTHWTRQDLEDHLLDYLYDELEPAQRAAFERALPAHPEVAREVEAHRATRVAFRGYVREPMPKGLLDDVIAVAEGREPGGVGAAAAAVMGAPRRAKATSGGLWEKIRAFVAQPAFAMAFVTLVVAGVGLVASRKGEVPGMPPTSDAQHLPPVAVTETTKAVVANADLPAQEEAAQGARALGAAAAPEVTSGLLSPKAASPEPAPPSSGVSGTKDTGNVWSLEGRGPPAVGGVAMADRDGLEDETADGKLARARDSLSKGPVLAAPVVTGAKGDLAGGISDDGDGRREALRQNGPQGWFAGDGDLESKEKVDSNKFEFAKVAREDGSPAKTPMAEPKDVANAPAPRPDTSRPANELAERPVGNSRTGAGGVVADGLTEGEAAKKQAKLTETRVTTVAEGDFKPAPAQPTTPAGRNVNTETYRGGEDAAAARAETTVDAKAAERKAPASVDDEERKREDKAKPRLTQPSEPAKEPNRPAAPPANATPERLWTIYQQQAAAGAWADAELTVAALAKTEGESARVKQARSELQKRVEAGKKGGEDKLPPDPPAAPNRNGTGGK